MNVMVGSEMRARARRLIATANELLAIAGELDHGAPGPNPVSHSPLQGDDALLGELARQEYRSRRSRTQVFDDEALFGEPAWDILLDLFIAAKEGKRVPVTSACIGAAVPTTTALRWISVLEERGLIVRENDAADARRVFVRLSTRAYAKMVEYFLGSNRPAPGSPGEQGEDAPGLRPALL